MRSIINIAVVAAIAAAALSCSEKLEVAPKMKTISVEMGCAQMDDASKTQLSGTQVLWSKGDINIICFTNNSADHTKGYTLSSTQNGALASKTFTGEIPDGDEPMFYVYDRNRKESSTFTFYKGSATYFALFSDADQRMTLGEKGNFEPNSFHKGCNYAVATASDTEFKSVFGYLKWTNNGSAIRSVQMEPLVSADNIFGWIKVQLVKGELVFSHAWDGGINYIISGMTDGGEIPSGTSFYAIVYPRTYHGLKLTINLADGTSFSIKTTKEITVHRGEAIDLGVLPIAPIE